MTKTSHNCIFNHALLAFVSHCISTESQLSLVVTVFINHVLIICTAKSITKAKLCSPIGYSIYSQS